MDLRARSLFVCRVHQFRKLVKHPNLFNLLIFRLLDVGVDLEEGLFQALDVLSTGFKVDDTIKFSLSLLEQLLEDDAVMMSLLELLF